MHRFFLKRAPFAVLGGELKLEHVRPAYHVLDAFHHGTVDNYASVTAIIAGEDLPTVAQHQCVNDNTFICLQLTTNSRLLSVLTMCCAQR